MFVDSNGAKPKIFKPSAALGYGRFMQPDPIGYGDGLNWYNYVKSNPVNGIDPTGTELTDIVITGHRNSCADGWTCYGPGSIFPLPSINIPTGQDNSGGGVAGDAGDIVVSATRPNPKRSKSGRLTCNGIPGFSAYQEAAASAIAENPASSWTPAWLRGIFIHSAFSRLAMVIPGTSINVSYKNGQVAGWLDFGSVRPDAVNGLVDIPNFVIELKTSNARLLEPQLSNYLNNLPPSTPICEIYEMEM